MKNETESKYIRFPLDFFSKPEIQALRAYPGNDKIILLYIKIISFAGKLDNAGKIQVRGAAARKRNILYPGNHLYPLSLMSGLGETDVNFVLKSIDIFLEIGLLKKNEDIKTKEYYYYIPDWNKYKYTVDIIREEARLRMQEYSKRKSIELKRPSGRKWTKEKLEEILKKNNYNASAAAKTVGIAKQYVSFLMKKFGIRKPE